LSGAALLGGVGAFRSAARPKIATCVVTRRPFRNEVLAFGHLQAVRSTPVSVPGEVRGPMRIAWLAPAGPVKRGDRVIAFDPTEAETQLADGRSDQQAAERKVRKAHAEGSQSSRVLSVDRGVAEEELRRAEDVAPADALIFSRSQILEGRVDRDLLRRRVQSADAKRTPTEALSAADVALAAIEAKKAQMQVTQAQRTLGALEVRAPHDGTLVFPMSWRGDTVSLGDTVWPGQPIAELPDLSTLEARVFVLEGDAGGLADGQAAEVEIEGQADARLEAKVTRVDAVAKSRERQSPVKYFETVLSLSAAPAASFKPGQRVRARIHVHEIAEAVVIPRGALFEKDGRRFVYRLERDRFKAVDVSTSGRSLSTVVIAKGLAPGDRIAMQDPERREPAGAPSGAPPGPAAGPAADIH
jgi:RND family efflux transporter MFP subunit